jgi:hypothetical protein
MIYEGEGTREEKEMGEGTKGKRGKGNQGRKEENGRGRKKNKGGEGNIRGMMVIEIYEGGGKGRGSTLPIM